MRRGRARWGRGRPWSLPARAVLSARVDGRTTGHHSRTGGEQAKQQHHLRIMAASHASSAHEHDADDGALRMPFAFLRHKRRREMKLWSSLISRHTLAPYMHLGVHGCLGLCAPLPVLGSARIGCFTLAHVLFNEMPASRKRCPATHASAGLLRLVLAWLPVAGAHLSSWPS